MLLGALLHATAALVPATPVPSTAALTRRAVLGAALPLGALPLGPARSLAAAAPPPFSIALPPGYVKSSRKATQGTVFVGGNFPRASVVSITAWPIDELLQQAEDLGVDTESDAMNAASVLRQRLRDEVLSNACLIPPAAIASVLTPLARDFCPDASGSEKSKK